MDLYFKILKEAQMAVDMRTQEFTEAYLKVSLNNKDTNVLKEICKTIDLSDKYVIFVTKEEYEMNVENEIALV